MNEAFAKLKHALPIDEIDDITKCETLQLAARWIAHLTSVLLDLDARTLPVSVQDNHRTFYAYEIEGFDICNCVDLLKVK